MLDSVLSDIESVSTSEHLKFEISNVQKFLLPSPRVDVIFRLVFHAISPGDFGRVSHLTRFSPLSKSTIECRSL